MHRRSGGQDLTSWQTPLIVTEGSVADTRYRPAIRRGRDNHRASRPAVTSDRDRAAVGHEGELGIYNDGGGQEQRLHEKAHKMTHSVRDN